MLITAEKIMPAEQDNSGWGGRFLILLCIAFFIAGIGSTFLYLDYGYDKHTLPAEHQPKSFYAWVRQSLFHPALVSQQLNEVNNFPTGIQPDLGHRDARYPMPISDHGTDERIYYRYFLLSLIVLPFVMLVSYLATRWYWGRAAIHQQDAIFMHDAWRIACHNLSRPSKPGIQRSSSVPPVSRPSLLQQLSPSRLYRGSIGRLSFARGKPPSS